MLATILRLTGEQGSEDNEVPRRMWDVVKTKVRKSRVSKTKERRKKKERKKPRKERRMEVRRVVEEWEIWKKKEKASKSKAEVKKLVPEKFHK